MAGVSIITAILGFAFVIFIHELGHFLFAKWAGVKVERFSIGMGPIIWSRTIGETEYALSILPIGGYVKMLGQEDIPGQAVETKDERSYTNKHAGWKAAILFGGVLFNIVSSYILLLVLAWYGLPVVSPQVGSVIQYVTDQNGEQQVTPAWKNDLQIGDRILTVNGKKVRSYTDIMMYSMAEGMGDIEMDIRRQDGTEYTVEMNGVYDSGRGTHTLGIEHPEGLRTVAMASLSGVEPALKINDRIVGIEGEEGNFDEMQLVGDQLLIRLSSYVGREIKLSVERDGETLQVPFTFAGQSALDLCGPSLGSMVMAGAVMKDSPAAAAKVQAGDYISRVNGERVINGFHLTGMVRNAALRDEPVVLEMYRYDEEAHTFKPVELTMKTTIDPHTGKSIIGIVMHQSVTAPYLLPLNEKQAQAMEAAGIQIGDQIVDWQTEYDGEGITKSLESLQLLVAKEAQFIKLPFAASLDPELDRVNPLGFWAKLFQMKPKPSLWSRLSGSRVRKAADEQSRLLVDQIDKKDATKSEQYEIDLTNYDKEQRAVFYELKAGDYIAASRSVLADGSPALAVIRGVTGDAGDVAVAWREVKLSNYGSLLFTMPEELPYKLESWTEGFTVANDMCKQMIVTTFGIIPRFFKSPESGGIDASKSLSGPIGIFTGMKQKTEYFGFASFLKLLAFIGINLFLVNLLPIPIVDGGQLVFLAIEVIIRRPVPPVVHEVAGYIGLLLIVSLMIFVLGIDIDRHFL